LWTYAPGFGPVFSSSPAAPPLPSPLPRPPVAIGGVLLYGQVKEAYKNTAKKASK